ncbi:MAG: hypothetical protein IT427_05045 [Pirellulales bacterium]|nr:hypothetical protein [Pirellulales bacterium]
MACAALILFAAVLSAREPAETAAEFPDVLTQFEPCQTNPVFSGAGEGHWDARIRERGWILHDAKIWHLWYTGYDGTREGIKRLGHATSEDGLHWTRDRRNPLDPEVWIEDMMIVRNEDTLYMFAEGRSDQTRWFTSPDGVVWKDQGAIDIRDTLGKPIPPGPYGTPTAWHERGKWYLLYERGDRGVWLATSNNLKVWTHAQDEPVLQPGPDNYDSHMIAANQVIKYAGRYYCYYHGSGTPVAPRSWTTNLAVSTDLIHWKKYPSNPLVSGNRSSGIVVSTETSFVDPIGIQSPFEFPLPSRFRLYTMHDQVEAFLPEK